MTTTTEHLATTKPAGIAAGLPAVGAYFACLAAYNNGRLHGAWLDLEKAHTAEEIQEAIDWVLATSPEPDAEEWAMHDHAGLPACLSRTEWPSLEALATYAQALEELDHPMAEEDREAYRLYCDDVGQIADLDTFREAYEGLHDTPEDYCQQLAEELGAIKDDAPWPCSHIDWSAAWRDLECDGYSAEPAQGGGVHIFRAV